MALSSTTSVSKGCFLFNPQAKPSTRILQAPQFLPLPSETKNDTSQRKEAYKKCWQQVKGRIEEVVSEQHRRVLSKLLQFIKDAQKQLKDLHIKAIAHRQKERGKCSSFLPSKFEIPTAALIAGVNMPDHTLLFEELKEEINSSLSPHVVLLKSKDCSSGMKGLMTEIRQQLMPTTSQQSDSSDSDEEGEVDSKCKKVRSRGLPLCSVSVLSSWYQKKYLVRESGCVPLVLVIEDFEGFSPTNLQDLITSLSPHLPDLPVVLVLGLATTASAVHRLLPQSVSSLLALEQIHMQPASQTFTTVLKEIFLSTSILFKLGPKCFKFLLYHFFYTNFSITNVTRHIQFAVMEHFFWQPLSILCCRHGEREELVGRLTHLQCEMVRSLPSYRRYVESLEPSEQLSLLEDDIALKRNACRLLNDLDTYHKVYYPMLECFHTFSSRLFEAPLGKLLHELYSISLECNPTTNSKFKSAWMYLRVLSNEQLSNSLEQCIMILTDAVSSYGSTSPIVLNEALHSITELYTELKEVDQTAHEQPLAESDPVAPMNDETTGQRKMRFQERLRQLASRKKDTSGYEALRARILDCLMALFKSHLQPHSSLPLHEVLYFDQHESLRKHLAAAPRVAIQTALNQPNRYLSSADVVSAADSIPSSIPNLCIVYQLHTECGKMINLYDWLQSYSAIANSTKTKAGKKRSAGKRFSEEPVSQDQLVQAQFIQCVSELQFLGFIKPTQRKADHVQRLTWGAC